MHPRFQNAPAYLSRALCYEHKMVIKLIPGAAEILDHYGVLGSGLHHNSKFSVMLIVCAFADCHSYPRMEHLKDASLRQASALLASIRQCWKGLP